MSIRILNFIDIIFNNYINNIVKIINEKIYIKYNIIY